MSTAGSWNTRDVRPPNKPQEVTTKNITFGTHFSAPPKLPLGFNLLDLGKETNIRAIASADDITKEGFSTLRVLAGSNCLEVITNTRPGSSPLRMIIPGINPSWRPHAASTSLAPSLPRQR